jgi:hypothetical protein
MWEDGARWELYDGRALLGRVLWVRSRRSAEALHYYTKPIAEQAGFPTLRDAAVWLLAQVQADPTVP